MARVTVEDSLAMVKNRFALVVLTVQRTKQLLKGSKPLIGRTKNKEIVTALREIAAGKVRFAHPEYLRRPDINERYAKSVLESAGSEKES
ncbi:MAG: DNA-directed RNA polymerase subunit omega [Syntrophobacterales bacterium]|nr:DNA-directed RNA polymerase subunit omega [Syntrophobacterales bacterium]